jgi:hypothetical protein
MTAKAARQLASRPSHACVNMMTKHRRVILSKNYRRSPAARNAPEHTFLMQPIDRGAAGNTLHTFSKSAEVFVWMATNSEALS